MYRLWRRSALQGDPQLLDDESVVLELREAGNSHCSDHTGVGQANREDAAVGGVGLGGEPGLGFEIAAELASGQ